VVRGMAQPGAVIIPYGSPGGRSFRLAANVALRQALNDACREHARSADDGMCGETTRERSTPISPRAIIIRGRPGLRTCPSQCPVLIEDVSARPPTGVCARNWARARWVDDNTKHAYYLIAYGFRHFLS